MMREHTGNEWQGFYPKTNLVTFFDPLDKMNHIINNCKVHTVGTRKPDTQIPKTSKIPTI